MTADDSTTRLMKAGMATFAMVAIGLLVGPTLSNWHSRQLAQRIAVRIEAAQDADVKVPLRQLADLGDFAIEQLVVASASERAAVAAIARQIIDEKLAAWEMAAEASTAETIEPDLASSASTLASALAAHIQEFGSGGKQWAECLTLTLIDLAASLPARPARVLLEDCTQVLAAIPPRGPRLRTVTKTRDYDDHQVAAESSALEPKLDTMTRASEGSLEVLARLIPNSPAERQGRLTSVLPRKVDAKVAVPRFSNSELKWSPSGNENHGKQSQLSLTNQPPRTKSEHELEASTKPTKPKQGPVVDIPTPEHMAARAVQLRKLSADDLLLRLRKADFYEAGVIRIVLRERGFSKDELMLRHRLTSPEVSDRLRLIEDVPQLPAAPARRLLRWLIEDENADIRLSALTALGTANAPDLTELARKLAVSDQDPRVAELASRLLKQTRQ